MAGRPSPFDELASRPRVQFQLPASAQPNGATPSTTRKRRLGLVLHAHLVKPRIRQQQQQEPEQEQEQQPEGQDDRPSKRTRIGSTSTHERSSNMPEFTTPSSSPPTRSTGLELDYRRIGEPAVAAIPPTQTSSARAPGTAPPHSHGIPPPPFAGAVSVKHNIDQQFQVWRWRW